VARTPLGFIGRVKGGPARGGLGRELRFFTSDTLAVAKDVSRREAGGGLQPSPMIPNAGIPRALAANRGAGDAFVTVAIGQTGSFNVGDLVPIWNAVQGTVYRVITAINAGTGQIDLDAALGIAFTVANGTQVNATDMEGHVHGWVEDNTHTWMQVTELGSGRVLAPVKVASAAPALVVAVQEEGAAVNSRGTINFIGRAATATDDGANNRLNVTIGIAGSESAPAPEVLADADTGLWGEGGDVLTIVGGGKRALRVVGGTTRVNYAEVQANVTGGDVVYGAAGSDSDIGTDIYTKGTDPFRVVHGGARVGFQSPSVASSVNFIEAVPSATGQGVEVRAAGSDTNIDVHIRGKGTGSVALGSQNTDYWLAQGGSGNATLAAAGGTATINLNFTPKGAGYSFFTSGVVYAAGQIVARGGIDKDTSGDLNITTSGSGEDINVTPRSGFEFQYNGVELRALMIAHAAAIGGAV
jgi:hypothetical protein